MLNIKVNRAPAVFSLASPFYVRNVCNFFDMKESTVSTESEVVVSALPCQQEVLRSLPADLLLRAEVRGEGEV